MCLKAAIIAAASTKAAFDILEANTGRYCEDHRMAGMINVRNKRCAHVWTVHLSMFLAMD